MSKGRRIIKNYMTVGKALKLSSSWDVAELSSSIRLGADPNYGTQPKLATPPLLIIVVTVDHLSISPTHTEHGETSGHFHDRGGQSCRRMPTAVPDQQSA